MAEWQAERNHSREMNMTWRCLVVAPLLLLPLSPLHAGEGGVGVVSISPKTPPAEASPADSIDFGGHRIALGMSQDQVLKLVGESYRVEPQVDDLWWVYDKTAGGTIGALYFHLGRLVEIRRDWEVVESEAGPAINTLSTAFAAVSQMVPGDLRSCKVYPDRLATQKGFSISCGPMLVQIAMTENEGEGTRVFVYTVLGSHQATPAKH
jgi:hypothetical protein